MLRSVSLMALLLGMLGVMKRAGAEGQSELADAGICAVFVDYGSWHGLNGMSIPLDRSPVVLPLVQLKRFGPGETGERVLVADAPTALRDYGVSLRFEPWPDSLDELPVLEVIPSLVRLDGAPLGVAEQHSLLISESSVQPHHVGRVTIAGQTLRYTLGCHFKTK